MSSNQSFISVQNVGKSFGVFKAVNDVSLDIKQGEFFSLLGASGCGKTTLLRMLAGFENVTSGEIYLDGEPMSNVPPFRRPVNMVFQNYAIFPHLNVRNNVGYGFRKLKLKAAKRDAMIDELLALMQLEGLGYRRANQLSGGQRQRIALARALIMKPKVLLLDEPLGALDKQLREQMQLELRSLQQKMGITFVFVTHDQEEALTLSDRIAVMSGGKVLQVDTPSQLYNRPLSRKVASFIGNMNFLNARVLILLDGRATVNVDGMGTIPVSTNDIAINSEDHHCVAVRPEKLCLHTEAPVEGQPVMCASFEFSTYLGERSHYHVRVPGYEQLLTVSSQNSLAQTNSAIEKAQPVWLTLED